VNLAASKNLPWGKAVTKRTVVVFKRLLVDLLPQHLDEIEGYKTLNWW
jgi:hypothetical protein